MRLIDKGDALVEEHLLLHAGAAEREPGRKRSVFEHHAMAGHATRHAGARMHGKPHETRLSRRSNQAGDLTVACHASAWDLPHNVVNLLKERIHFHLPAIHV